MAKKRLPVWDLQQVESELDALVKVLTAVNEDENQGLLDTEQIVETIEVVNHSMMQVNFQALSEPEVSRVRVIKSKIATLSAAYSEHKNKVELTIRSQQNTSKLRKAYG